MTFNKFINCETLSSFNSNLESGVINDSSIVFIEESKQIYTHGQFYSCPYTKEEIDNLLSSKVVTKADIERVLTGNIASHTHSQYLTSYTETDPTVPSWAKSPNKPTYTASEVGALASNGTAVNASKVSNSLILKLNSGTTEGTNLYTFNGSSAKSIDIKSGSNVSFSTSAGVLTISSTNTTYGVASTSANGLMSSSDKSKLDGIASGANNYSLPTASSSVLGGVKVGSNITLSSGVISLTKSNVTSALGYTPPTTNTTYNLVGGNGTTGLIKNGSTVTSSSGYTACPIVGGIPYYKDTNTTYTLGSFGVTASSTELNYCKGVTSAIQTQLNSKASSGQTFYIGTTQVAINRGSAALTLSGVNVSGSSGSCTGNSATASRLATARNIAITGSVTGNANFDGSGNITISTSTSHGHSSISSRGDVTAESGTNLPAVGGLSMGQVYNNGYPVTYGNVMTLRGSGSGQLLIGWSDASGAHEKVYVRSKRDLSDANWSGWAQVYTSAHPQTSVTGSSGSCTGNAASATYIVRDRGQNTVSTLASLPITKSTVIANLGAATNISLAGNMNVGESITVICNPTANFTQPIPTSGSFTSMDGSSLSVTSGKKFEINIYCYNTNVYSISCKVAK